MDQGFTDEVVIWGYLVFRCWQVMFNIYITGSIQAWELVIIIY